MNGGRALVRMRLAGKRPPGFVVLTESWDVAKHYRHPNRGMCALVFDPAKAYDWRLIHGLDVALITKLERRAVATTCQAIFEAGPRSFAANYWTLGERDVVLNATH